MEEGEIAEGDNIDDDDDDDDDKHVDIFGMEEDGKDDNNSDDDEDTVEDEKAVETSFLIFTLSVSRFVFLEFSFGFRFPVKLSVELFGLFRVKLSAIILL